MNNGVIFGISNLQMKDSKGSWNIVNPVNQDIKVTYEDTTEYDEIVKNLHNNFTFTCNIHKKRKGTIFEKHLYYINHKKKRIRKKYDLITLLNKSYIKRGK